MNTAPPSLRDGRLEAALQGAGADGADPAGRAAAGQPPRPRARPGLRARARRAPTSPATTCGASTGRSPPAPPSRTCARPWPTASWRRGWCVDLSPSLDFGTAACEKRDLAIAALAAVAHLTRGGGNRIGALVATGEQTVRIPARGGLAYARGLVRQVAQVPQRAERHPRRPRRGDRAAAPPAAAPRAGRGGLRLPRRAHLGAAAAGAVGPPRTARRRGARPARAGAARGRHGRAGRPGDRPPARGRHHAAAVPGVRRRRGRAPGAGGARAAPVRARRT